MGSQTESQLHVVDFNDEDMKPGTDTWLSACQTVRKAFEDHSCFIALYDKAGLELYNSVFSVIEELFDLPVETKKQETSDKLFSGYYGLVPKIPLYESSGIDNPLTIEGCKKFTNLMWPQGNDRFCESVNRYSNVVAELDQMVKRMVFESYGVSKQRCDSFLESNSYLLRGLKYRAPQMDESNLGLHGHTDLTFMSIVQQSLNGLEIKLKTGEWIEVDASPSSFAVMAGDAFPVWSNDRVQPCEHRVLVKSQIPRYSVGLFSYGGMLEIPEELVDEENPLRYKPFDHYGYLGFFHEKQISKSGCLVKEYCGV